MMVFEQALDSPGESPRGQLERADPVLSGLLQADDRFYLASIDLIAGMGTPTRAVREAMQIAQLNRAQEGVPGRRFLGAGGAIEEIETLAVRRACDAFGFAHANVQPHSGTQANQAALQALCAPGDTILSMALDHGGHLSHGYRASLAGALYHVINYHVDPVSGTLDLDELCDLATRYRPRVIVLGASSYPRFMPLEEVAGIAAKAEAFLMVDASHNAGFLACGMTKVPSDPHVVLSVTTEKTLCGPRGAMILCDKSIARRVDRAVFPRMQSSFSLAAVAGKAACLGQVKSAGFVEFLESVRRNAKIMADVFIDRGLRLATGGTDTHMVIVDLSDSDRTGRELEKCLLDVKIQSSRQVLARDRRSASECSGIRFGTTCLTARGCACDDVRELTALLAAVIKERRADAEVGARFQALATVLAMRDPPDVFRGALRVP